MLNQCYKKILENNESIKINSLVDLKKYDLLIIDKSNLIINNVSKILKEKGLSQSDLSKLTGICKQNISEIVKGQMLPGIILASQIAKVLNKNIEEVFELTEASWVKTVKIGKKDITLYLDLYTMEIINNEVRKKRIETDNKEYLMIKTNKVISKSEYEELKNKYISEHTNGAKRIKWKIRDELLKKFDDIYTSRYKKLGEKISPIISN